MHRYLQFRLRSLFLLTTLAAVACVVTQPAIKRYLAYREQEQRRQQLMKCLL